ncbi:MAG TPA: hypothetical protein VF183_11100, partial [Acidimicrobiales bacterium]
ATRRGGRVIAEQLINGWEPELDHGDSILRAFVHAVADRMAFMTTAAGGRVERLDDALIVDARSTVPFDNGIVLLRPPPLIDIDAIVQRAGEVIDRTRPHVLLSAWLLPDLRAHGYDLMGHPPFMYRPAAPAPVTRPDGLDIRQVQDADELAVFVRTLIDAYPMPRGETTTLADPRVLSGPVKLFLGYAGDRPVATAGVYVGRYVNDVEWVSTMPDARRRGYGEALTWAATLANPDAPAALIASDDGQPVYERMGYVRVQRMTMWFRRGASPR